MKPDLDELRSLGWSPGRDEGVQVRTSTLRALVAVVDAARHAWCAPGPERTTALLAALEPFTPPADRAWEEVDRWHAKQDALVATRQKRHVDVDRRGATHEWRTMIAGRENYERLTNGPPPPDRDAIRDQLADAGVAVQRQFRSDQERIAAQDERIAELERERDDYVRSTDEEWKRAEDAEARLARVPTLVEALRKAAAWLENGPPGELDDSWPLLEAFRTALAEWEKP